MNRWILAALAAVLAAGAGCTSPAQLQLAPAAPRPPAAEAPSVASSSACTVCLQPLEDRRKDPTLLGSVGGRAVNAAEAAQWVEQELLALASPAFRVAPAPASSDAILTVTPTLHKLYVDNVAVTKTAVVVLELTFAPRGGVVTRRFYRGQHASMNWASNEGEITNAVKRALADCLAKVRVDLAARAQRAATR